MENYVRRADICGNLLVNQNITDMTGEFEDRQFIVTRPDSRIAMTIARNEYTAAFSRKNRFLIDDPDSGIKLSYELTKPVKLGSVYNGDGVYNFVLQEVNSTADDNYELGIADYYKYYPNTTSDDRVDDEQMSVPEVPVRKGWL